MAFRNATNCRDFVEYFPGGEHPKGKKEDFLLALSPNPF